MAHDIGAGDGQKGFCKIATDQQSATENLPAVDVRFALLKPQNSLSQHRSLVGFPLIFP